MKQYLINFAILLDELGNTLTGGDPGETISSRAGKGPERGQDMGMCPVPLSRPVPEGSLPEIHQP